MKRLLATAAALLSAVLAPVRSDAGTAEADLAVSANVLGSCTIVNQPFEFGDYDPSSTTELHVQHDVTVNCTYGTSYEIALDDGSDPGDGWRRMTGGSGTNPDELRYQLYRVDFGDTVWDDAVWGTRASAGTDAVGASPYGHTIYGVIPVGQAVTTGAYSDTVHMTVVF